MLQLAQHFTFLEEGLPRLVQLWAKTQTLRPISSANARYMRQAPLLLRSIVPECTLRTSLALVTLLTQLEESTWLPRTVDRIEELLRNLEILLRCCIAAPLLLPLPSPGRLLCHRGAALGQG